MRALILIYRKSTSEKDQIILYMFHKSTRKKPLRLGFTQTLHCTQTHTQIVFTVATLI